MNKKIFILMFVLAAFSAFGKEESSSKWKSNQSFIMNAGGGLGGVFGFVYYYRGMTNYSDVSSYLGIGGTAVTNYAVTFDVGKRKRGSVGLALQLGYNGQFLEGEKAENTMAKHAFISDLDFMARYSFPKKEVFFFERTRRFVFQIGLRMGALFNGSRCRTINGETSWIWEDKAIFAAGPNIFIGADCVLGNSFMLEYGLRFAAAFGGKKEYGLTTVQSYLDFAFELKFNWQKHFKQTAEYNKTKR